LARFAGGVPVTERSPRWHASARAAVLLTGTATLCGAFWAGGTTDSGLDWLILLALPLAGLAGYLSPWAAPLLPPLALALALVVGNRTESFDNDFGALNFVGGLVFSWLSVAVGVLLRATRGERSRGGVNGD
jgi:hypothetical protein